MKISIKPVVFTVILALFIISTGCQEQQSSMTDKKAMLVGNQNLQLKKQLQQKDVEIQRQKDLVIECQDEMLTQQKQHEQSADGMLKIMQLLVESEAKVQQLEAELATLKDQ